MTATVDLLCVGSGAGTLGAAVAAARSGMSVMYVCGRPQQSPTIAQPAPELSWADVLSQRWGIEAPAPQTNYYLNELTADLGGPEAATFSEGIDIVEFEGSAPIERSGTGPIPPFYGSRVRTWALRCMRSTSGVVFTDISLPGAVKLRDASNEAIEVNDIAVLPRERLEEIHVRSWLLDHARQHGVQMTLGTGLQELVFDDGQVVGAILNGPYGHDMVLASHGVMLGTGSPRPAPGRAIGPQTPHPPAARLCLNSRPASRFFRLEVVVDQEAPHTWRRHQAALTNPGRCANRRRRTATG